MIKLENYNYLYKGTEKGIKNINLELNTSRKYALIGPNGSGKSTLISTIVGHTTGNGKRTCFDNVKHDKLLSNISFAIDLNDEYLTQSFHYVYVKDICKHFRLLNCDYDKKYAAKLLDKFNINIHKKFGDLSKGNKLLVHIINCLSRKTKFYIIDEPFGSLDQTNRKKVIELLEEKSKNAGILISSHDVASIFNEFDEFIFIKEGSIESIKSSEDYSTEDLKDYYITLFKGGVIND